ncbi:MAG: hypothetical protein F8N37_22075 [Telmatospirillum sp.]|nr:hypothetical protein [Telmatospirillum sp.]
MTDSAQPSPLTEAPSSVPSPAMIDAPSDESALTVEDPRKDDPSVPVALADDIPPPDNGRFVHFPADCPPLLSVIIDAEEEFAWDSFTRSATSVTNIRAQTQAQALFEPYGVVPTYCIDYPVASQEDGIAPLRDLMADGRCEIGAQLHSWVTPPFDETITRTSTFAGNLPKALELAKIRQLTEIIGETFGIAPKVYRAGRYGLGPNTADALVQFGYEIDCSVLPWVNLRPRQGPDFSRFSTTPFWLDQRGGLLELPVTAGMVGLLESVGIGATVYRRTSTPAANRWRVPAVLSRLGFLNRIPLTPEGTTLSEAKKVTRWLAERGHRTFCVNYHSSSLAVGHTPYVRNSRDLTAFLDWLSGYLEFFFGEIGGQAATPGEIRLRALGSGRAA